MTTTPSTSARESQSIVTAWAVLIVLTLLSWWLGTDHGGSAETATSIVLIVSFAKVLLVGNTFMELRHAALPLRAAFWALCVSTCMGLLILYHVG